MKKKVLPVVIVLATAVGIIAFRFTFAWFRSGGFEGNNKSQQVIAGALNYEFTGEIRGIYEDESSSVYVAPGENLIFVDDTHQGPMTALNKSSIATNLRVKIEYTYFEYDEGTSSFVEHYAPYDDSDTDLTVTFASPSNWDRDDATGWWYYHVTGAAENDYRIPAVLEPTTQPATESTTEGSTETSAETTEGAPAGESIPIFTFLGYSDTLEKDDGYDDEQVKIKLTVEVKQADYVDWETLYEDYYG